MNDILDIEIILQKQKYPLIYNVGIIILLILLVFIYISGIYNYKTYYITLGTVKNNYLELLVNIDDIKYISNQKELKIDNKTYKYSIKSISEKLYVDESKNNYKYVHIKVHNLSNIENYVYKIKIEKENKKIIEHIKDYI